MQVWSNASMVKPLLEFAQWPFVIKDCKEFSLNSSNIICLVRVYFVLVLFNCRGVFYFVFEAMSY